MGRGSDGIDIGARRLAIMPSSFGALLRTWSSRLACWHSEGGAGGAGAERGSDGTLRIGSMRTLGEGPESIP